MNVKFPVGTTEENNQLNLPAGFITIDSDKKALRLFDGETQGGFEVICNQAYLPPPMWEMLPDMLSSRRFNHLVYHDGYVYSLAGVTNSGWENMTGRVDRYNVATRTWENIIGDNNTLGKVALGSAVLYDGKILLHGGYDGSINHKTTWELDTTTGQMSVFSTNGPLTINSHSAVMLNGLMYVFGGVYGSSLSGRLDAFNPTTRTWQNKLNTNAPRRRHASVMVNNGIFIFGGGNSLATGALPVNGCIQLSPTLATYRNMPSRLEYAVACSMDGRVYIYGGFDGTNWKTTLYEFNPATNSWRTIATLPPEYVYINSSAAFDGDNLYLCGSVGTEYTNKMATINVREIVTRVNAGETVGV